jgi:hypothetical protein
MQLDVAINSLNMLTLCIYFSSISCFTLEHIYMPLNMTCDRSLRCCNGTSQMPTKTLYRQERRRKDSAAAAVAAAAAAGVSGHYGPSGGGSSSSTNTAAIHYDYGNSSTNAGSSSAAKAGAVNSSVNGSVPGSTGGLKRGSSGSSLVKGSVKGVEEASSSDGSNAELPTAAEVMFCVHTIVLVC